MLMGMAPVLGVSKSGSGSVGGDSRRRDRDGSAEAVSAASAVVSTVDDDEEWLDDEGFEAAIKYHIDLLSSSVSLNSSQSTSGSGSGSGSGRSYSNGPTAARRSPSRSKKY